MTSLQTNYSQFGRIARELERMHVMQKMQMEELYREAVCFQQGAKMTPQMNIEPFAKDHTQIAFSNCDAKVALENVQCQGAAQGSLRLVEAPANHSAKTLNMSQSQYQLDAFEAQSATNSACNDVSSIDTDVASGCGMSASEDEDDEECDEEDEISSCDDYPAEELEEDSLDEGSICNSDEEEIGLDFSPQSTIPQKFSNTFAGFVFEPIVRSTRAV